MVHLYCNGSLVALSDVETIKLTQRFTDIQSFQTTGGFSQTFRVPYETNQAIFGALFSVNVVLTDNYMYKKLPAEIRVNSIPVHVGYVRVMKVVRQMDLITDLELVFYAETPDLVKALGTKKLKDIAALSDLNHAVDNTHVTNTAYDYRYIMADRGYKWSNAGEAGTRPVFTESQPIFPAELTPVLRWSYIFQQIITEAGFTLDASDIVSILEGYWMPWINEKNLKYAVPPEAYFFRAAFTSDQSLSATPAQFSLPEIFDNNGDFASGTYTAPLDGEYTFRVFLNATPTTGFVGGSIFLAISDTSNNSILASTPIFSGTVGEPISFVGEYTIYLTTGQTIGLFRSQNFNFVTYAGDASGSDTLSTGFALVGFSGALFGQTLDMALNAPDMLQIDFISDVIKMHNCAVIPDKNVPSKIKFQPMVNYLASGSAKDWTHKIAIEKDITITTTVDLQKQKLKFSYKEGGDVWNKVYKDHGRVYGEYSVQGYTVAPTEDPSDFTQGETTVQLVTQPTPSNAINGTSIIIPKFVNEQGDFVVPGARVLFLTGTEDVMLYDDGLDASSLTPVYIGNNYSQVLAEADDYDLNFAPEVPPHDIVANPYNNLFNLYWRPYLNSIYSEQARMMECFAALELTDILNFSFADRVFIKDAWWRVLELSDYVMGEMELTKLTLLKIIETIPDCDSTPVGVNFDGTVVFHDGAGSEVSPTQACCVRYGYTWSVDTCYAFGYRPNNRTIQLGSSGSYPDYMIALAANLNVDRSSFMSVGVGQNITVEAENRNFIAVGDTIELRGQQRGAAMFGKNVLTNLPGFHLGGGWLGDDRSEEGGSQETGTFVMSVKGGFSSTSTELELLIEGISGKRINLIDKTGLACIITLNLNQTTGGVIAQSCVAQFGVYLYKEGTASAGTVHDIFSQSSFITPHLVVDTATDTDEHRLKISTTGGGHPHNDCILVATVNYIQTRHA